MFDRVIIQQNQHWQAGRYTNLMQRACLSELIKSLPHTEMQVLQGIRAYSVPFRQVIPFLFAH